MSTTAPEQDLAVEGQVLFPRYEVVAAVISTPAADPDVLDRLRITDIALAGDDQPDPFADRIRYVHDWAGDGMILSEPRGWTSRGDFAPLPSPEPEPVTWDVQQTATLTDQDEVSWVKEHSGLTWDQLGKVFGVSRRAVHMWANGGRLNQAHAERLRAFASAIRVIEADSPTPSPGSTRAALLRVGPGGLSIVDRARRERSGGPTWAAPFGPEHMVGATREPLRASVGEAGR